MPLCLIQSLPGTIHSLTDSLSVVVPDLSKEVPFCVPLHCRKEVREGRCAWHSDSAQTSDPLCIDDLANLCAKWRDRGLFSFIEIRFTGALERAEKEWIQRLAHVVDWLIVDGSSVGPEVLGGLEIERWSRLAAQLRQAARRVGLRLGLENSLPVETLQPWIAQLALQLGEPGFLFVEGLEHVSLVRSVQDLLIHHPLSRGSARLIPVVRSIEHPLGDRNIELLDVPLLDALVIESTRPFFGGVAVAQGKGESLFGHSLWQMIISMICDHSCAASLGYYDGIPQSIAAELIRRVYALGLAIQHEECQEELAALEKFWSTIDQKMIFGGEQFSALRALVGAFIEQAHDIVGQRSVKRPGVTAHIPLRSR